MPRCGAASIASAVLLDVLGSVPATLDTAVRHGIVTALVDCALALAVVPLARLFLHSHSLRAPRPILLVGAE